MRPMPLMASIFVSFLYASCGRRANLHDRIMAANTSQYCLPDACFNPHVLSVESGFVVTTFVGSRPQHANIQPKELANYLQSLPVRTWPRGPSIEVSPTDVFA